MGDPSTERCDRALVAAFFGDSPSADSDDFDVSLLASMVLGEEADAGALIALNLVELGVRPDVLLAFLLAPPIHVAWASGHVQTDERKLILTFPGQTSEQLDAPLQRHLIRLLSARPSTALFRSWMQYVYVLRTQLKSELLLRLQQSVLNTAMRVAAAAGGGRGIHATSMPEARAIHDIQEAFAESPPVITDHYDRSTTEDT